MILSPNPRGKISTNSQINPETMDENEKSKLRIIKMILYSGASASIVRKNILYKRQKILYKRKNK